MKQLLSMLVLLSALSLEASDSLQYLIFRLPCRPFIFRSQKDFHWYAVKNSVSKDSVIMQREYNASSEQYTRKVQIQFPVSTSIIDVTRLLENRNPSDTSIPSYLRNTTWLIGVNKIMDTGTYTNNELAYDAAYNPFRNSLRIGNAFHFESEFNHITFSAQGNVYEGSGGSLACSHYKVKYTYDKRDPESGDYHREYSEVILKSPPNISLSYSELPSIIWCGHLDDDKIPDFILSRNSGEKTFQLVLSGAVKQCLREIR